MSQPACTVTHAIGVHLCPQFEGDIPTPVSARARIALGGLLPAPSSDVQVERAEAILFTDSATGIEWTAVRVTFRAPNGEEFTADVPQFGEATTP
jgi:hypothetical protein